jgi:stearoyl-CoA desaturase (Delta-9 desaturase)
MKRILTPLWKTPTLLHAHSTQGIEPLGKRGTMPTSIIVFLLLHYVSSLFCQTFFLHRYASHRMFTMSPRWERFFYWCTYVAQGPSFLPPRAYAWLHRSHHAYSDTKKDPHSPQNFSNVFTMMWRTKVIFDNYVQWRQRTEQRFEGGYPEIPRLDQFSQRWSSRIAWGTLYALFYLHAATAWWHYGFVILHNLIAPIQGAMVNWCGHRYGYRNYDTSDESRNTLPVDVLVMGELYQNNHHEHPMSANFAARWFELDLCYQVMRVMAALGIIRFVKQSPTTLLASNVTIGT